MAKEGIKRHQSVITKSRFLKWNVMSFEFLNATSTFSPTMNEIFKD
jgi:hypothetical protein